MYLKLPQRAIFWVLPALALFTGSCVDDGYDLSDLNTDDLFVGDFWTMPLGKGIISAAELLDVKNNPELSADANGDYIARYTDVILATPAGDPALRDRNYSVGSAPLGFASVGGTLSARFEINGTLPIEGNQYMKPDGFQRAEFFTGPSTSLLRVTATLGGDGSRLTSGTVEITLPQAFEIDDDFVPYGITVLAPNRVEWNVAAGSGSTYTTAFPVRVVDTTSGDDVNISGTFTASAGTSPSGVSFTIGFENLIYSVIYGQFDLDFNFSPTSANIGNLYNIFEGDDAVLSFRDPHIIIESESTLGMPVVASLDITPDTGTGSVSVDQITLPPATYVGDKARGSFWVGEIYPGNGYTFARAPGLGTAIRDARQSILVSGSGEQGESNPMFYPSGGQAELRYTLEIPFAPGRDFYAVTRQVVKDAFTGDIVDYLFNGGTAELYGTITNSIPLRFELKMIITDSDGDPVGIDLAGQDIAKPLSSSEPSVSEVSFPFTAADMDKMSRAANIDLLFTAYGVDDAPALNRADALVLDLKLGKTGGINISSDDDDE